MRIVTISTRKNTTNYFKKLAILLKVTQRKEDSLKLNIPTSIF